MPGLEPLLQAGRDLIDVVEIEPETHAYMPSTGPAPFATHPEVLRRFQELPFHVLLHGVGMQAGGTLSTMSGYRDYFDGLIETLSPAWVSEHLSFNRVAGDDGNYDTAFLLPPLQTAASVELAVSNIREFCAGLKVPFAFETGVNYLQPKAGEMSEGRFWAEIAEQADCGILLDLHNLWCNQLNGRQSVLDAVAELPLERVWEIHLAGGESLNGYWLDAHSDFVPKPLYELAREIVPQLPNLKAINFEIMDDYVTAKGISTAAMLDQMHQLRDLWRIRGTRVTAGNRRAGLPLAEDAAQLPAPAQWERLLGDAAAGNEEAVHRFVAAIGEDPGIGVFRELSQSARAGIAVSGLVYGCRFLLLQLGRQALRELLTEFWMATRPQLHPLAECRSFARFLRRRFSDSPYLPQLLDYDLAVLEVKADRDRVTVEFQHQPDALLQALDSGRVPEDLPRGNYRVSLGSAA